MMGPRHIQPTLALLWARVAGAFGPGGLSPFIFNTLAGKTNIQADRAANNGAITGAGTIVGAFQAGSDTSGVQPGVSASYASVVGGDQNNASGEWSFVAGGLQNTASGMQAYAEGFGNLASGDTSHAEGSSNVASTTWAHAEGLGNTASGHATHAEGDVNVASGHEAHAEGFNNVASGDQSHAEGTTNTASATGTHAEGFNNTASGNYAHCEGESSTAGGIASHAEGLSCTANGNNAHAEGLGTSAAGTASHAHGQSSIASRDTQEAFAGGGITVAGDSQQSRIVLRGVVPAGGGGNVNLEYGFPGTEFSLENGKAYLVVGELIAQSATDAMSETFSTTYTVAGGTITALGSPPAPVSQKTAGAAAGGWALNITEVGLVLRFNFINGSSAQTINVTCTLRFTEVTHP